MLDQAQFNNAVIKNQHTTTYTYDPTYYFLKTRSWYQNANTLVSETYDYYANGRLKSYSNARNEVTAYCYDVIPASNTTGSNCSNPNATLSGKVTKVKMTKNLGNGQTAEKETLYSATSGLTNKNALQRTTYLRCLNRNAERARKTCGFSTRTIAHRFGHYKEETIEMYQNQNQNFQSSSLQNQGYQGTNLTGQLHQCQNIVQQLINQTQQATQMYQQMLQQEQQNAARLEELAQREQRAVQMIQTALHGHQTAIQQMNQVSQMCRQLEQSVQHINTQTFSSTVQPLQSYGASSYGTSASAGMTNRSFQ